MRKTRSFAAIVATFILCFGLACCSAEEVKTKDEIFGFEHNEVIRKETTATEPATEEFFWEFTEEYVSDSGEESRSNEPPANTTAPKTTRPRRTTTAKPVASTAAPTTQATTVPTTRKPIVTEPPEIEYPTVTTTVLTVEDEEDKAFETELLRLVNAERSKKNLPDLKYSKELAKAADIRARELTVTFSHNRPDGSTCFTVSEFVYGENIAAGQTAPTSVINSWMNSQGHKDNILNETYKSAAIGCYNDGDTYYWVLLFGY